MTKDIHSLRKAFLEEDGGSWIAGEDLHKEAGMNVEVAGKAPSSMELMLIKDPAERERYRADMAARNESMAMKRPLSPKETVTRQTKTAGGVRDFFAMLVKNPHQRKIDMAIQDASRKTGRAPGDIKMKDLLKSYNELYPRG